MAKVTAKDEWKFKGPSLYLMVCGASRRMREVSISNRRKEATLAYKPKKKYEKNDKAKYVQKTDVRTREKWH